jgi:hypothetical protein
MAAIVILIAICLLFFLSRLLRQQSEPKKRGITVTMRTYDPERYSAQNEAREKMLKQRYPHSDKWIFSNVAGVSHKK